MGLVIVILKRFFCEFAEENFVIRGSRKAKRWERLGILDPLIRAVVGDTTGVVFRKRLPGLFRLYLALEDHQVFGIQTNANPFLDLVLAVTWRDAQEWAAIR